MSIPVAAVIAVGDELLLGETVDTNSAWLGRELARVGVSVGRRYTVGDVATDIRQVVGAAAGLAELVVVTGGLGPTPDDLTRDAVAELFGRAVVEDPTLAAALERRFAERGHEQVPASNRTQARVPEGARVLTNRHGTAPGLAMEEGGVLVALLPGVPREMRGVFEEELLPMLTARYGQRLKGVRSRVLHTSGVPESRLSELVEEVLPDDMGAVSVAFLPDALGVDLHLTARGLPARAADAALDRIEAAVAPVIERWRFHAETGDLAEAVTSALRARRTTLGVGESCTGGALAHRIARVPGISDVFLGGVVTYANAAKQELLGVAAESIRRHGAVSEEVARQMAEGAARVFGAGAGIGITGIAGPGGGSEEKPVGTVWTAVALEGSVTARRVRFQGDRESVQALAAQDALKLLYDTLKALERGP